MSCASCAGHLVSPVLNTAYLVVVNDKAKYKLKQMPYLDVHVPSLVVIFIVSKKQRQLQTSFQE